MSKKKRASQRTPADIQNKDADLAQNTQEPGEHMTTNQGLQIADDQNSLKAGPPYARNGKNPWRDHIL